MKTVEINGNKVILTITPNFIQRLFGVKVKTKEYTIIPREYAYFPSLPVLMDSKGEIVSPISTITRLVNNKLNLNNYSK